MSGCHAFKGYLTTHLQGRAKGTCSYVQNNFRNFKCTLLKIMKSGNKLLEVKIYMNIKLEKSEGKCSILLR